MERIPILKIGDLLLVSIQVDLQDRLALALEDDLSERIVATGARGVLIDISVLEIVDSFIGRMLSTIASLSRVLDAETVVVGMRPAVAITLVELGLYMPNVRTALTVEHGLALLGAEVKVARVNDANGTVEAAAEASIDDGTGAEQDVVGGDTGPKAAQSSGEPVGSRVAIRRIAERSYERNDPTGVRSRAARGPSPRVAEVLPSGRAPAAGRDVSG
jgi:rsbT antagonist protein RsbS